MSKDMKQAKLRREIGMLGGAMLLVPLLLLVARYYPQTVTVTLFKQSMLGAVSSAEVPRYEALSKALIQHPYANRFTVRWGITDNSEQGMTGDLHYDRRRKTLTDQINGPPEGHGGSWEGVTEDAIHAAARKEKNAFSRHGAKLRKSW